MGFTRTHKSTVVAVVAAVDITRTHISVVVVVVVDTIVTDYLKQQRICAPL